MPPSAEGPYLSPPLPLSPPSPSPCEMPPTQVPSSIYTPVPPTSQEHPPQPPPPLPPPPPPTFPSRGMATTQWEREEEMKSRAANGVGDGWVANGKGYYKNEGGEKEQEFNPASKPPFGIGEIRAAIPKHCWVKSPWRSLSYVFMDAVIIAALGAVAAYLDSWVFWPLYWAVQGTMFWAVFVLGHDCGHGSFSDSRTLNNVVGHILHSFILVPYHGWRISHRTHHQNHGHVENDESWHPIPESVYKTLESSTLKMRFTLPFPLLAYPAYLLWRSPGKAGSHFHPYSDLFAPNERMDVVVSTACWSVMASLLAGLMWVFGPLPVFKLYWAPLWIYVMWLDLVTYLHHHGHERKLPWYRGEEWSYLRGALTTVDRDYGWLNKIHHNIETHVVHHLFPQIPHYNLVEATKAAKPVLGKYYREPEKSGPLPFHLLGILMRSLRMDHFVSDIGDVVYYQTDPRFSGVPAWKLE